MQHLHPDDEAPPRARLSSMLIAAALVLPALAFGGILLLRRVALVHYPAHTMEWWLALDATILAIGLIVRENEDSPRPAKRRRIR